MKLTYHEPGTRQARNYRGVEVSVGQTVHVERTQRDRGATLYDILPSVPAVQGLQRYAVPTGEGHYTEYLGEREVVEVRGEMITIRALSVGE